MRMVRSATINTTILYMATLAFACERWNREPDGLPPRTHPTEQEAQSTDHRPGPASDDVVSTMWAPIERVGGERIGQIELRPVASGTALHLRATNLPEGSLAIYVRSEGGCEAPLEQPSGEVFRAEVEADGTADVEWVIPGRPGSILGEDGRAVVVIRPGSTDVACAELQIDQDEERPHGSGRPALSPTPPAMPPHSPRGEDEERF